MKDDNYFSWQNVNEMADIDSHIKYATVLKDKYDWDSVTKAAIEKKLDKIVNKQNDNKLNICVIGEFSTGKSSFINALICYDLLPVNSIQGTTVAITVIDYGKNFSIAVTDYKNHVVKKRYGSIDILKDNLYDYVTNARYKDKICYITVTLPSDVLKLGYRIIDTPGTDSLELWHEKITEMAVDELSDLSIVVIDANKPLPESCVGFLKKTLRNNVSDCAFVANKIDLIRKNERSGIVKYIGVRLKNEFGVNPNNVLPFSSVALTNEFSEDKFTVDNDSFRLTTDSLGQLLCYTAKNRIKIQARKTLNLIDKMYSTLNNNLFTISQKCEDDLQLLERTKHMDLKPFIDRQILTRKKMFMHEAECRKSQAVTKSDSLIEDSINSIYAKLDTYTTLDNLSNYIGKGDLSEDIKNEAKKINSTLEKYFKDADNVFHEQNECFRSDFLHEFERLSILSVNLDASPKKGNIRHLSHSANISDVNNFISEELSKENWSIGGGIAAGAAIGSIVPVIGTGVGAFLGAVFGAIASPDLNEVKAKAKLKLEFRLKIYFGSVANDSLLNYDDYINEMCNNLEKEIFNYYSTYNSIVEDRIRDWEQQYSAVKAKILNIRKETEALNMRQNSIQNLLRLF